VKDFEGKLHGYLRDRVAGRIGVHVDGATPERVLEAARPIFDKVEGEHEARALDRVGDRGVAGIDAVVAALNERRVEVLMLDEQFSGVSGVECSECGLLATAGSSCPADGAAMAELDDLTDATIELAVQQSAEVLAIHHHREALDAHGGAAALLRF
jgi:peptide subunit release factor 1 (eRF1)